MALFGTKCGSCGKRVRSVAPAGCGPDPELLVCPNRMGYFRKNTAREGVAPAANCADENFYQHAEHYFRISNSRREGNLQERFRPTTPADVTTDAPETGSSGDGIGRKEPGTDDYADL
jgi:hypothetical protein